MLFITQPSPKLFPIRNRIIASLAKGVLIIEAAVKSGSFITAQEAANRSIDVMAVVTSQTEIRMPNIIDYTIAEIFLEQTPELLETESQAI